MCASKGDDDGFERAKKRIKKLEVLGTCQVKVENWVWPLEEITENLMKAAKTEDSVMV